MRFRQLIQLFSVLFLTAGCTLKEACMVVDLLVPDEFHYPDEFDGPKVDVHAWWEGFSDDQLKDLLSTAAVNNHDFKNARERLKEICFHYGMNNKQAEAKLLDPGTEHRPPHGDPRDANDIDKGKAAVQNGSGFPHDSYSQNDYHLRLLKAALELDLFGRKRHGIQAAVHEIMSADELVKDIFSVIRQELINHYIGLRKFQTQLAHLKKYLEIHGHLYKRLRDRVEVGLNSQDDLDAAHDQMGEMKLLEYKIRSGLDRSLHELSRLIGENDVDKLKDMVGTKTTIPDVDSDITAGTPLEMVKKRADVRTKLRILKQMCSLIGYSLADQFPKIYINLSLEAAADTLKKFFSLHSVEYAYGVSTEQNIYQRWKILAKVRVYRSRYEQAKNEYHRTVTHAIAEVGDIMADLVYAKKSEKWCKHLDEEVNFKCKKAADEANLHGKSLTGALELNHKAALVHHQRLEDFAIRSMKAVDLVTALGW